MKNYILAIMGAFLCMYTGYKLSSLSEPVSINKELVKIGNELEQLIINEYFCDINRDKELKAPEQLMECYNYRRNLLTSNESLKIVLDNISLINCSKKFVESVFSLVDDLYYVTSSLIIYENKDINIGLSNTDLSKEILKTAQTIRRVDSDLCLIRKRE